MMYYKGVNFMNFVGHSGGVIIDLCYTVCAYKTVGCTLTFNENC